MPNRNLPVAAGTSTLAVPEADVNDEIRASGLALGDMIQKTGLAVAETQNLLNQTSASSATALANTLVDVVAVEETKYRDDGTLEEVIPHVKKLPLVNFIDPVFYQWSNVRIQGQFMAREFATASKTTTHTYDSSGSGGQHGLLVIFGGGQTKSRWSSTDTTQKSNYDTDYSIGRVRMNSRLEPRHDVSVPRPKQAVQGPRLTLLHGEITNIPDGENLTRTMSVIIQYNKSDGTAIGGKRLSIETEGVPWAYEGSEETDPTTGQVEITLTRSFTDPEQDRSPVKIPITARMGIVQNSTVVTF